MSWPWRNITKYNPVKENNGRAASVRRRKGAVSIIIGILALLMLLYAIILYWTRPIKTKTTLNSRKSAPIHNKPTRKHTKPHRSRVLNKTQIETMILNAELSLVNLHIPHGAFSQNQDHPYSGILGLFCKVDWNIQKQNPSSVPMFKNLVSKSRQCDSNTYKVDLSRIVQKARAFDDAAAQESSPQHDSASSSSSTVTVRSLPTAGFIFHESRCGSTLLSNILSAIHPNEHRVYSEAIPPINALRACDDFDNTSECSEVVAANLLRDVVYLMGRTNNHLETKQFFKIQSIGMENIGVFRMAFPNVPWLFLYRDPIQVMMSHLGGDYRSKTAAVCLRGYHDQEESVLLSREEYCASTLATFCNMAIREHEESGTGRMVNYANVRDTLLLDSILPDYFGLEIGEEERRRAEAVASVYSKGGSLKDTKLWVDDSSKKEELASEEVKLACRDYLEDSYDTLEGYSTAN